MAKSISKNAKRTGKDQLLCGECEAPIQMRTRIQNGQTRHYAVCSGCGKTARRPTDLMNLAPKKIQL